MDMQHDIFQEQGVALINKQVWKGKEFGHAVLHSIGVASYDNSLWYVKKIEIINLGVLQT